MRIDGGDEFMIGSVVLFRKKPLLISEVLEDEQVKVEYGKILLEMESSHEFLESGQAFTLAKGTRCQIASTTDYSVIHMGKCL